MLGEKFKLTPGELKVAMKMEGKVNGKTKGSSSSSREVLPHGSRVLREIQERYDHDVGVCLFV